MSSCAKDVQGACHCRYVKGNGRLVGQELSLADVRLLVVSLVVFAGFMHCDELLKLQCSDIAFGTESMTINVRTDHEGREEGFLPGSCSYRDTYIPYFIIFQMVHVALCQVHHYNLPSIPSLVHIHVYLSTTKHHLHHMLLYSLQHQLPTRSVLHHDNPPHVPHTVELYCSGKGIRNKGITDAHTVRRENSLKVNMKKRSE